MLLSGQELDQALVVKMKGRVGKVSSLDLAAGKARLRNAKLPIGELSGHHYRALSRLFKWAAGAEPHVLQRTLPASIHAIEWAISHGTEVDLSLPVVKSSEDPPLTLAQQYCNSVAGIYDRAASDPACAADVQAHIDALDEVFQGVKALWTSDDAAAHYLKRSSTQYGGRSPLQLARQSSVLARQAAEAINAARADVAKATDDAQRLAAERPAPTADTVADAALDLLGSRERAEEFLRRPHPLLADQVPLDVACASAKGAARVERLIRQALAGTAI